MITVTLTEKMRDDLKLIFNREVVTLGNCLRTWLKYASANKRNEYRARFDRAVDFLHELNTARACEPIETVPTLDPAHPRNGHPMILPRDWNIAENPSCVHGRTFNEACDLCAAPLLGQPASMIPNRDS